jgi:cell wall assembly regulator SMI1
MRNLEELGIWHSREPLPPPTSEQIEFVESLIGAKLPESYVAFLRFSNGGRPEARIFYDRTEGSREEWEVDRIFHLGSDTNSTENVIWNYQHRWAGAPREVLPIAEDGSGNLICLDLTDQGNGRVIVWVHDDPDLPIVEVSNSFEEFIDSLALPPD